jgi:hypothetical protein
MTAMLFNEKWSAKVIDGKDPTEVMVMASIRSDYSQVITGKVTHETAMAFARSRRYLTIGLLSRQSYGQQIRSRLILLHLKDRPNG